LYPPKSVVLTGNIVPKAEQYKYSFVLVKKSMVRSCNHTSYWNSIRNGRDIPKPYRRPCVIARPDAKLHNNGANQDVTSSWENGTVTVQ
jgi:hypothetical protein